MKKVHCVSLSKMLMFCYCSQAMSIHALTERLSLPDNRHKRGMQQHCIMVCKLILGRNSSLLGACYLSWSSWNLWIVHAFQLYIRSHFQISACSHLHCNGYTYLYTALLLKKNSTTIVQMHNRSSQNACLQWFFSRCTHHLLCREYNYWVWNYNLHARSGGGNVQQLYTSSSISMLLLVLDLCLLLSHRKDSIGLPPEFSYLAQHVHSTVLFYTYS